MAQQTINLGTSANAGDGDNLRSAMDKTTITLHELYGANSVSSNICTKRKHSFNLCDQSRYCTWSRWYRHNTYCIRSHT